MEENKDLAVQGTVGMGVQLRVTEDQKDVIKKTLAVGATDAELELFVFDCLRRGVHPMDRLIHFVARGEGAKRKVTHQASIDYMRSVSEDGGDYAGMDEPIFDSEDNKFPKWCKVTVYRMINGERLPFTATGRWSEFYPGGTMAFIWDKMPYHMLAKCTEALARRMAFPKKLGGLYAPEEMDHVEKDMGAATEVKKAATVKQKAPVEVHDAEIVTGEGGEIIEEPTILDKLMAEWNMTVTATGKDPDVVMREASGFTGSNGPVYMDPDKMKMDNTKHVKWMGSTIDKLRKMREE